MSTSQHTEALNGEVVDSTAVDVYQPPAPPPSLFRTDDPVEVIEKATKVADALKGVVAKQGLITRIQGREHPRVEAWQTLGSMLGVFPIKEWVRPLPWPEQIPDALKAAHDKGLAFGFEASFVAQRPDGAIVGGGEAACMRTEKTWASRDDYALRSMAQTRATSKALKAPLGFVMSLAGYETTPAEEMPSSGPDEPQSQPEPEPELLPEASVTLVLEAISRAKMGTDWTRSQLVAIGAPDVPEGRLTKGTIQKLTPEQAVEMIKACDEAAEAKAAKS